MAQNLNVKTEGVSGIQSTAREPNKSRDKKFYSDIEEMMFGFGDEWPPDANAVRLLESFVVSYIEDLADRALDIAELRGKLDKECFMFLVRKDRKKFSRVHKLLKSNEELKTVQKVELKEDI
jgi:transcription initiation factor TFIID subunit 13